MKKFSKLISAALLITQTFAAMPLNTLAETTHEILKDSSEQTITTSEESNSSETISSSSEESSTSSTGSGEQESSTEPSDSSSTPSESSTTPSNSGSSESSSTEPSQTKPSQTQPSEEKPKEPVHPVAPTKPKDDSKDLQETSEEQNVQGTAEVVVGNSAIGFDTIISSGADSISGSIHFEKDESVESFIHKIGESARKIGKEKDLYASVMIAQAILESASGQSKLAQEPNYNLFGIKGSHNGKTVSMSTQEDSGNGNLYTIQSGFKVYENYEDSFNDYATLLKDGLSGNKNFYEGVWKSSTKSYQDATKFLTGRYATDTQYDKKLNGLIETYGLTQYDKEVQGAILNSKGYKVPVDRYTISSPFGKRGGEFHRGLDLAASQGEPIHAVKTGIVIKAEFHSSWGNYVVIQHEDGMTTLYAHQQQYVVKPGDKVDQGQTIGYVGTTGNSTGPHLHLELCQDDSLSQGSLIDPQPILFGN